MHSLRFKLLITYFSISFITLMFFSTVVYKTIDTYYKPENKNITTEYHIDKNEINNFDLSQKVKERLYILNALASIIVGILSFFASGVITRPLKDILEVIQKMIEGRLDQKIKIKGKDEIAELSMAFNQMSAKLQKVDLSRQEFVANVSHELKTPLSSMKVLSESLLFQEDVPEEMYKEFLQDINSEIDRLNEIINNLLVVVKLDRRAVPLNIENINLNDLIRDIVKRLQPLAQKKEIELQYEELKEVTAEVDRIKFTLAISNLVENGIKYTNNNGTVKVKIDGDHQNGYISVKDNGIGIPEEEQNKIFERFYRVDKTRDRETGGTGLGLSITHRTILLHNGNIKLTSKENEGSTFTVRIPLKQND